MDTTSNGSPTSSYRQATTPIVDSMALPRPLHLRRRKLEIDVIESGNMSGPRWQFPTMGTSEELHVPFDQLAAIQRELDTPRAYLKGSRPPSVLYSASSVAAKAGKLIPVTVLFVSIVLFASRFIYEEVVTAIPLNGGTYNALLNTTSKRTAAVAACLIILSYVATAVASPTTDVRHLNNQVTVPIVGCTILLLAKQHGSVESLLDSFFNLLYRRTHFYVISSDPMKHKTGFLPGEAQEKVLTAFQKHPMKNLDGNKTNSDRKEKVKATTIDQASSVTIPMKVPIAIAEVPKLTAEGKQRTDFIYIPQHANCVCNVIPVGNGGVAENYSWTQTLEDISVGRFITCELFVEFCSKSDNVLHFALLIQMVLKNHTQAKDLKCRIESARLSVTLKSGQTKLLLAGEFPKKFLYGHWRAITCSIFRLKRPTYLVGMQLEGDPEIDSCQVDSRRDIHEYDEGTQGAIRKAVYDQRQQQLSGGNMPLTSEEQMLQEAMDLPSSLYSSSQQ
ncbi:hypothetical protein PsorP6_013686 [Peronosclerospora sorghi]|uniref:Uncharacterized protein n=1 Tax=Peronosclerospora sorghi TaxID=230839 RepID=A0ACC0VH51_9STRA|nr:hypothetical protein PsorP6_013686 [Peronosclerospora sorghi]